MKPQKSKQLFQDINFVVLSTSSSVLYKLDFGAVIEITDLSAGFISGHWQAGEIHSAEGASSIPYL